MRWRCVCGAEWDVSYVAPSARRFGLLAWLLGKIRALAYRLAPARVTATCESCAPSEVEP